MRMPAFMFGMISILCALFSASTLAAEKEAATAQQRLKNSIQYLASDDLDGRGVGTDGLNEAAEYLADKFKKLGLNTELFDGTPFQKFTILFFIIPREQ